jgi:hypothetical protein
MTEVLLLFVLCCSIGRLYESSRLVDEKDLELVVLCTSPCELSSIAANLDNFVSYHCHDGPLS